jgi:16S RNA G1207 methylase RsmC
VSKLINDIYSQLFQLASHENHSTLWVVDENVSKDMLALAAQCQQCVVITNRFDIYCDGQQTHTPTETDLQFSDFDFSSFSDGQFDQIIYRVSKERAVTHWVLSNCATLLKEGGTLFLAGAKEEGIKTYIDKTNKLLPFSGKGKKYGPYYIADLNKISTPENSVNRLLNHKNYPQLRSIGQFAEQDMLSKPGVYGWNKIDEGSTLLAEEFDKLYRAQNTQAKENVTALDLGCGYGYLSLAAANAGIKYIVATDNNAAALNATKENLSARGVENQNVIATDCGEGIKEKFDWVLCNPPFHQGFAIDSQLTEKFVRAAKHRLKPKGRALFVVNAFIPLEKIAADIFRYQTTLINNRKFKVIELKSA